MSLAFFSNALFIRYPGFYVVVLGLYLLEYVLARRGMTMMKYHYHYSERLPSSSASSSSSCAGIEGLTVEIISHGSNLLLTLMLLLANLANTQ